MTEIIRRNSDHLRWLHEFLFSIYFSFLTVSAHEHGAAGRWAIGLMTFYSSHDHSQTGIEDYRLDLVAFLLVWLPTVFIFGCLRLLAGLSLTKAVLRTLGGIVAAVGFPLLCLCSGNGRLVFVEVELGIAAISFVLWACEKWPVSAPLNVFLLVLHYAFWSSFGGGYLLVGGWILLWPGWHWARNAWGFAWIVYPALGFVYTLVWAKYFRQSKAHQQTGSHVTAGRTRPSPTNYAG